MTRARAAVMEGRVAILLLLLLWQSTFLHHGKFGDLLREKMINIHVGISSLV
jgi:hypothetical protein